MKAVENYKENTVLLFILGSKTVKNLNNLLQYQVPFVLPFHCHLFPMVLRIHHKPLSFWGKSIL